MEARPPLCPAGHLPLKWGDWRRIALVLRRRLFICRRASAPVVYVNHHLFDVGCDGGFALLLLSPP